jgi:hypothetical protein
MKIKLVLLILILTQISCKNNNENQVVISNNQISKNKYNEKVIKKFDLDNLIISRGQIGNIKVGMNIGDAEKSLIELTKKEVEAYDFGYDGGGSAYIYSFKNEPILALVPERDSKEILVIIALSKNLKTNNGLNPKSTVKEIQKIYPAIEINQDLMMSWEFMHQENNNWDFIFMTEENNRIGEYKEIDVPSKPIKTEINMDWITIK